MGVGVGVGGGALGAARALATVSAAGSAAPHLSPAQAASVQRVAAAHGFLRAPGLPQHPPRAYEHLAQAHVSRLAAAANATDGGEEEEAGGGDRETDGPACPKLALGNKVMLQARTWGAQFTADVKSDNKRVGYIRAELGDFHQHMYFYTTDDRLVASAYKPIFSWGVDRTTVVDCNGKELLHMALLQARNKYSAVSRYEIDDTEDDELADSKFYYQLNGGDFKVNAVGGSKNGENLLKAESVGFWGGSMPPAWTVKLKPSMADSPLANDAPSLLLWLAEEERGMWGLSWGVSAVLSGILIFLLCFLYCGTLFCNETFCNFLLCKYCPSRRDDSTDN